MNGWFVLADIGDLLNDFGVEVAIAVTFLLLGGLATWLIARWERSQQRRSIARGDARHTVVIEHHLVEKTDAPAPSGTGVRRVPKVLRIRTLGQARLDRVVPNGYLAHVLLRRAMHVTPRDTLIGMHDTDGSYLLETLTGFVCQCVGNAPFDHDLYVMAPCCEPAGLAQHQPITILLISVADLALFQSWPDCRDVQVEHGTDGARILTLRELARRFQAEQGEIERLHKAGQRTTYVETMYILDLALDKRSAAVPARQVPWGRFEAVLKDLNLEA